MNNEIKTIKQLADVLNIKVSLLNYVLYNIGVANCYKTFKIPKKMVSIDKLIHL